MAGILEQEDITRDKLVDVRREAGGHSLSRRLFIA